MGSVTVPSVIMADFKSMEPESIFIRQWVSSGDRVALPCGSELLVEFDEAGDAMPEQYIIYYRRAALVIWPEIKGGPCVVGDLLIRRMAVKWNQEQTKKQIMIEVSEPCQIAHRIEMPGTYRRH